MLSSQSRRSGRRISTQVVLPLLGLLLTSACGAPNKSDDAGGAESQGEAGARYSVRDLTPTEINSSMRLIRVFHGQGGAAAQRTRPDAEYAQKPGEVRESPLKQDLGKLFLLDQSKWYSGDVTRDYEFLQQESPFVAGILRSVERPQLIETINEEYPNGVVEVVPDVPELLCYLEKLYAVSARVIECDQSRTLHAVVAASGIGGLLVHEEFGWGDELFVVREDFLEEASVDKIIVHVVSGDRVAGDRFWRDDWYTLTWQ